MCRNVWKASIPSHPVKAPSHCAGAEDEACQPIVHRAPCCQANGWHNQPKTKRWRILICSVLQKFQRSDYWISLGNVSEISQVIRWKSCSVLRISCRQAQKALLMKFKVWWLCGIFSLVFFWCKISNIFVKNWVNQTVRKTSSLLLLTWFLLATSCLYLVSNILRPVQCWAIKRKGWEVEVGGSWVCCAAFHLQEPQHFMKMKDRQAEAAWIE